MHGTDATLNPISSLPALWSLEPDILERPELPPCSQVSRTFSLSSCLARPISPCSPRALRPPSPLCPCYYSGCPTRCACSSAQVRIAPHPLVPLASPRAGVLRQPARLQERLRLPAGAPAPARPPDDAPATPRATPRVDAGAPAAAPPARPARSPRHARRSGAHWAGRRSVLPRHSAWH